MKKLLAVILAIGFLAGFINTGLLVLAEDITIPVAGGYNPQGGGGGAPQPEIWFTSGIPASGINMYISSGSNSATASCSISNTSSTSRLILSATSDDLALTVTSGEFRSNDEVSCVLDTPASNGGYAWVAGPILRWTTTDPVSTGGTITCRDNVAAVVNGQVMAVGAGNTMAWHFSATSPKDHPCTWSGTLRFSLSAELI